MPFITQGKANIKYLLIVVLAAAVAGGIIFTVWNNYQKELTGLSKEIEIKKNDNQNISISELKVNFSQDFFNQDSPGKYYYFEVNKDTKIIVQYDKDEVVANYRGKLVLEKGNNQKILLEKTFFMGPGGDNSLEVYTLNYQPGVLLIKETEAYDPIGFVIKYYHLDLAKEEITPPSIIKQIYDPPILSDEVETINLEKAKIEEKISYDGLGVAIKSYGNQYYLTLTSNGKEKIIDYCLIFNDNLRGEDLGKFCNYSNLSLSPQKNHLIYLKSGYERSSAFSYNTKTGVLEEFPDTHTIGFTDDEKYLFVCADNAFGGTYYGKVYDTQILEGEIYSVPEKYNHGIENCSYDSNRKVIIFNSIDEPDPTGKQVAHVINYSPETNKANIINYISTSTDKTANWKTYINSEYGFELKYPELLNSYPVSVAFYDYVPVGGTNQAIGDNFPVADGNVETQTDKPDRDNWPWLYGKSSINFLIFPGTVTDLEYVIGVPAQKVNLNNAAGYKTTDSYGNVKIFVQNSKNIFQINYGTSFGNNDQISKNRTATIEKIISTFKFSK